MHIGIDYGSKLAGTTAISYLDKGAVHTVISVKNQDADNMILEFVAARPKLQSVYIDAPLSLPAALYGKGNNYFYRKADAALKAMSPMFLGGLTARAIRIKDLLQLQEINCHEVYPGGLVRSDEKLKNSYSKKDPAAIKGFMQALEPLLPVAIGNTPTSWHMVDALLCWWIGYKHQHQIHTAIGDVDEGIILI